MFLALTDFSFLSICSTPSYSFSFVSFLVLSDFFFKLNDFKSFFILYVLQIFSFIDIEKMGTITFKQVFSFLSANLFSFLFFILPECKYFLYSKPFTARHQLVVRNCRV